MANDGVNTSRFMILAVIVMIMLATKPQSSASQIQYCGNINISFPFGIGEGNFLDEYFSVTCNETSNPPRAYVMNNMFEVTNIYLDGRLRVLNFVAHDCYRNGVWDSGNTPSLELTQPFTVNNVANKFTIVGCDAYGFVYGTRLERNFTTGCTAICEAKEDLIEGSCSGLGCCQATIPRDVSTMELSMFSYENYTTVGDFSNCSHGFIVEEDAFIFSSENLTNLNGREELPMLLDWAIGNETCEIARRNLDTYACKGNNSVCRNATNGSGYLCYCQQGYTGNPYLENGCEDVDECDDPNLNQCEYCHNDLGGYSCYCPDGYHGHGRKDSGCFRDPSNVFKLVAGIAIGVIALIFVACWSYYELKRRKLIRMKQKFFLQNGGMLLKEKFTRRERSSDNARIFTLSEIEKATDNFHTGMVIGRGGFGTVYKGILPDDKIVAIKKSKEVDPAQVEQFINEVTILSCMNHRNVVRLLGCCLETQVPLLVYEFVDNGTLSQNIHDKEKSRILNWEMRLKIAAEAAGVLSYMHSAASTPIIHRDLKSDNILLDQNFTTKVSDFGSSRLVPVNQTKLSTIVQGTFGYLDPEYMQTNQLTEKSDVYSFGVVLAELLTGRKPLSYNGREDETNLANFFLRMLRQDRLVQILEESITREENMTQLMQVAKLAQRCLQLKGCDRPSMKEVALELEGLRLGEKEMRIQVENYADEEYSSPERFLENHGCSSVVQKFETI